MLRSFTLLTLVAAGFLLSAAEAAECRHRRGQVLIPAGGFWMGSDTEERSLARSLSSPETVAAGRFSVEIPPPGGVRDLLH